MTISNFVILAIPANRLVAASHLILEPIYQAINDGYKKPTEKYGIVLTPRVKSVGALVSDLGFLNKVDKCILYLMVNEECVYQSGFSESFEKQQQDFYIAKEGTLEHVLPLGSIVATLGFKPLNREEYELTAYVSLERGCGKMLLNKAVTYFQKYNPECLKVVAKVIVEHNLVPYYEYLGFQEVDRYLVPKKNPQAFGFEPGFEVSQDFNYAVLERGTY